MKGLSLPINVLIIVAVALIVLIAIIAMFYPAFSGGSTTVSLDVAKSQACRSLIVGWSCDTTKSLNEIPVDNFDANNDGQRNTQSDNLLNLCINYYQIGATDYSSCRKICGCDV